MEFQSKQFILGKEKFPAWFDEQVAKGRAKVNYDDDNDLINVTVYTPTKTVVALPEDTIMLLKSGLTVIKKEAAKKARLPGYGNNKGPEKQPTTKETI